MFSEGTWKVKTVTGQEEGAGATGQIVIVLCGHQAETDSLPLTPTKNTQLTPGAQDEFEVKVNQDIGDPFKVRIGFQEEKDDPKANKKDKKDKKSKKDNANDPKQMSWFVEKVRDCCRLNVIY